jgi:hypothetical protein
MRMVRWGLIFLAMCLLAGCASDKKYVPFSGGFLEPDVTIVLVPGETKKVYRDVRGLFWDTISGYVTVDDPAVAKVDFHIRGRKTYFYLTGVTPGKTGVYYKGAIGGSPMGGMIREQSGDADYKRKESPSFWVEVREE